MQFKIYFRNKVYLHSLKLKAIQFEDFQANLVHFLEKRLNLDATETLKLQIQYLDIAENEKIEVQCDQDHQEITKHYKTHSNSDSILKFYISANIIQKFQEIPPEQQKVLEQEELKQNKYSFDLQRCEYCGRSFNPNSYKKHMKICQDSQNKRQIFDSKQQRKISEMQEIIEKENIVQNQIQENKIIVNNDEQEIKSAVYQVQNHELCEICGRSFQHQSFIKHLKICQKHQIKRDIFNSQKQRQVQLFPSAQTYINQIEENPIFPKKTDSNCFKIEPKKCEICGRQFANQKKVDQHMPIHRKREKFEIKNQRITETVPIREMREMEPETDWNQIIECPEGCGRKFLLKRISAHQHICKKLFQTKPDKYLSKMYRWKNYAYELQKLDDDVKYQTQQENINLNSFTMQSLIECEQCHRKFRQTLIKEHQKLCLQNKNKKKLVFNSKQQRQPNQILTDISLTELLNTTFEPSNNKITSKSMDSSKTLFEYFTIPFPKCSRQKKQKHPCYNCKSLIIELQNYYYCFQCKISICEKCEPDFQHFHPLFKIKDKEQAQQIKELSIKIEGQSFISGQEFDVIFDNLDLESQDSKKLNNK